MATISVQYINPFFGAVKRICSETIKVPVTAGTPRLCNNDDRLWKLYPMSAVIQLASAVQGMIAISFSEPVALALASGLAQETYTKFDANALDSLGEVANLIVGSAKRELPGGLVTISPPRITQTYHVEFPTGLPHLILPFETGCGRFVMQMVITAVSEAKNTKPPEAQNQKTVDALLKKAA